MAVGHPFNFKRIESRNLKEVSKKLGLLQRFVLENQNRATRSNIEDLTKVDLTLDQLADDLRGLILNNSQKGR